MTPEERAALRAEVDRLQKKIAEKRAVQPGLPTASPEEYSGASPSNASFWDRLRFGLQRTDRDKENYLAGVYKQPIKRGPGADQFLIYGGEGDPGQATSWRRFREDNAVEHDILPPEEIPNTLKMGAAVAGPATAGAGTVAAMGIETLSQLAGLLTPGQKEEDFGGRAADIGLAALGPLALGKGGVVEKTAQQVRKVVPTARDVLADTAVATQGERLAGQTGRSAADTYATRKALEEQFPGLNYTVGEVTGSPMAQNIESAAEGSSKYVGKLQDKATRNVAAVEDALTKQKPPGVLDALKSRRRENYQVGVQEAMDAAPGTFGMQGLTNDLSMVIDEAERQGKPGIARLKALRDRLLQNEGNLTAQQLSDELVGVTALVRKSQETEAVNRPTMLAVKKILNDYVNKAAESTPNKVMREEIAGMPGREVARQMKDEGMRPAARAIQKTRAGYAQESRAIDKIESVDDLLTAGGRDPKKLAKGLREGLAEDGEIAAIFKDDPGALDKFTKAADALEPLYDKFSEASKGALILPGTPGAAARVSMGVLKRMRNWAYMRKVLADKETRDAWLELSSAPEDILRAADILARISAAHDQ